MNHEPYHKPEPETLNPKTLQALSHPKPLLRDSLQQWLGSRGFGLGAPELDVMLGEFKHGGAS